MSTKSYVIEFYSGNHTEDNNSYITSVFQNLLENSQEIITFGNHDYEIRGLEEISSGRAYRGIFAKFRHDDIPHAGKPGGDEWELELAEDEGLIEKNYFIYYKKNSLLIYQRNGSGSRADKLAEYLTELATGSAITFNPIVRAEAMKRILQGKVQVRSIDISIAAPKNPQLVPNNSWNKMVMSVLKGAGAVKLNIQAKGRGHSHKPSERYLDSKIKGAIKELWTEYDLSKAKVDVEGDDGITHPIDLVTDRILSKQIVEMNGRYPISQSVWKAIEDARKEVRSELDDFFGIGNDVLH